MNALILALLIAQVPAGPSILRSSADGVYCDSWQANRNYLSEGQWTARDTALIPVEDNFEGLRISQSDWLIWCATDEYAFRFQSPGNEALEYSIGDIGVHQYVPGEDSVWTSLGWSMAPPNPVVVENQWMQPSLWPGVDYKASAQYLEWKVDCIFNSTACISLPTPSAPDNAWISILVMFQSAAVHLATKVTWIV